MMWINHVYYQCYHIEKHNIIEAAFNLIIVPSF